MNLIQALILGVVQGLTEFLPVSSSAHLVIVPALFHIPSNVAFDAFLHLGTLTAVVGYFWRDILALIGAFFRSLAQIPGGNFTCSLRHNPMQRMAWLIILGSIPAAVLGLVFRKFFEGLFSSLTSVGICLLITAVVLWAADKAGSARKAARDVSLGDGILVGLAQAVAIAPGISRSGATISAGLVLGFERELAARFSFLLSVPAILGATVLQHKGIAAGFHQDTATMLAGFAAAAVFGWLAIRTLLRIIRTSSLRGFAVYCALVGLAVLVLRGLKVF